MLRIRNRYVNYNRKASNSTFGNETYYGQDFIYKTKSGKLVVFDLPYPFESKGNIAVNTLCNDVEALVHNANITASGDVSVEAGAESVGV